MDSYFDKRTLETKGGFLFYTLCKLNGEIINLNDLMHFIDIKSVIRLLYYYTLLRKGIDMLSISYNSVNHLCGRKLSFFANVIQNNNI